MEAQARIKRITSIQTGDGGRIFGEGFVVTFNILGQIFRETVFISGDNPEVKNREKRLARQLGRKISELGLMIERQALEGKAGTIVFCGIKMKTFGWS